MNINDLLYQDEDFTEQDQAWVLEVFSHPMMKKYLRTVARNDLEELASLSTSNLSDGELSKKHSLVQGKLSTELTPLNINKGASK